MTELEQLQINYQSVIDKKNALQKENEELKREIAADDIIIGGRKQLLAEIPECPMHGEGCIPNAIEWIESIRKALLFYADGNNYKDTLVDADSRGMHSEIDDDCGKRARKVLKERD